MTLDKSQSTPESFSSWSYEHDFNISWISFYNITTNDIATLLDDAQKDTCEIVNITSVPVVWIMFCVNDGHDQDKSCCSHSFGDSAGFEGLGLHMNPEALVLDVDVVLIFMASTDYCFSLANPLACDTLQS